VAFFVLKGDQASGWRGRGFEGTVGDQAIQQISMVLSADTVIGSAAKSLTTWSGGPGSHTEDHLLINRLGEEPPQRIVAIPLTVRGRAVAVLYADSAGLDSESINLEALETLVSVSGMAVELLSVARGPKRAAVEEAPAKAEPAPPTEAYVPSSEYETAMPVEPEPAFTAPEPEPGPAFSGAETIQSYEAEPVQSGSFMESGVAEEATTFSDEAPQSSDMAGEESTPVEATPAAQPRRRFGQDAELPVEVYGDEERRLHNDARRFARLLISEIKLYNEQKVAEGRAEHDLYDRLREYIDRSREMYDKRVKAEVASRYDYFHGELVNTLAEGDVSKLGSNYPGATVNA
jgi:hypothetical protein